MVRRSFSLLSAGVLLGVALKQSLSATTGAAAAADDWLVQPPTTAVTITTTTVGGRDAVVMSNGLISRTFITSPNWATWSLEENGEDLLRSVQPEASFQLDNATMLNVGGVIGTTNFAFKNASDPLAFDPNAYKYVSHRVVPIAKRFEWVPGNRFSQKAPWPPLGLGLEVTFSPPNLQPTLDCPSNCSADVCPPGSKCSANPGGRWVSGPNPGEHYPYYGKPCSQQSDCAQCTLDHTCTCERVFGQMPPAIGCCKPNAPPDLSISASNSTLPVATIVYEMYQGLPAMSKTVRFSVPNSGCHTIRGLLVERLAFQETHLGRNNHFDTDWAWFQGNRISLFTSYARGPQYPCHTGRDGWVAGCSGGAGVFGIVKDLEYKTSYQFAWPSLLQAGFPLEHSCALRLPCLKSTAAEFCVEYGPCPAGATYQWGQTLCGGANSNTTHPDQFTAFTVFELFHAEGADSESRGLATRRMHAKLAPQVTENPIYMHCTKSDLPSLTNCVDQASAVGFEMVIISFGAGFNLESTDPQYLAQMRNISAYARSKGIEVGGYDLLAHTRGRGHNTSIECINPAGKPDGSTCLASQGSDDVFNRILSFVETTDWGSVETDGPYEGETCSSTTHTHHAGLHDSVFTQWTRNMDFYHQLVATGVYINAPDPYFLDGTHKDGMGYDEEQWGKPRWEWIAQARQQIYDQTYHKIASMGWQFCPIEPYNGGPDSIIEPIAEHLQEYEYVLATYLGTGTQAAYRGTRLYDPAVPASKLMVAKWVRWFKQYRVILNCDIIHVRRPGLNDIDAMLHVNANLTRTEDRGMLIVWNQTPQQRVTELRVPLYYTGLQRTASVSFEGASPITYTLSRDYSIILNVSLPPMSLTWALIK